MEATNIHNLKRLIREVNRTHKGLGPLIGLNLVAAKANKCVLNVAPAGTGKSVTTDTVVGILKGDAMKFTSITLAGLVRLKAEFQGYRGCVCIDDLGAEKSDWSRTSTVECISTLVHTHFVRKVTQTSEVRIDDFYGSAIMNIQPILLYSIIKDTSWIAVVRDKVIRAYHLVRPVHPALMQHTPQIDWTTSVAAVEFPSHKGKLWWQLVAIALTQWSYGRVIEHLPDLLRACAAIDGRKRVEAEDYRILIKLLRPMVLERYLVDTAGFETGREFNDNLLCMLVEIVTHGNPSFETICEDYKCSPRTVDTVVAQLPIWFWIQKDGVKRVLPTEYCKNILKLVGAYQTW